MKRLLLLMLLAAVLMLQISGLLLILQHP